ncbi:ATP-binding protein [Streptomyces minutiscleroticus]|uniref:ATP-binding protein n=1 Tax=Streptomyces minutiscleroticus TaxID=68238 RepID=A0A918U2Q9_9ACTN|nr:ATP-binding protein [Streptomyces minutiscleroticus]GGX83906.1 ATP-binding protein [Streptomyces minutiscleroticus]
MDAVPGSENAVAPHYPQLTVAVALEGDDSRIAWARRLATDFLTRLQTESGLEVPARVRDLTQLVVSELVTNAYKYAPGPARMELRTTGALLEITVRDTHPVLPTARAADPDRIGQHGLEIVTAVAHSLDIEPEPGGKRITARLPLTDASRRR